MAIILVICAIIIFLAIWGIRRYVAAKKIEGLTPTVEAVIRIALCLLAALIVYYTNGVKEIGYALWLTILATAFILYGVTHFLDRLLLKR